MTDLEIVRGIFEKRGVGYHMHASSNEECIVFSIKHSGFVGRGGIYGAIRFDSSGSLIGTEASRIIDSAEA